MSFDVRHIIWDGDDAPASDPSVGRGVGTGGGAWTTPTRRMTTPPPRL